MKQIKDYEIVSHGFELSDYFQGCGVAFTKFSDVATGCGATELEAYNDALDQMAGIGIDVSKLEAAGAKFSDKPLEDDEGSDENEQYDTMNYYLSIRYNTE